MIENKTQTHSRHDIVNLFMKGLALLEKESDPAEILWLFADDCVIGNVQMDVKMHGPEGARRFWTDYRHTFREIESKFSRITETEDVAVLEWTSEGTLITGQPVKYSGASVLTISNERIVDFMAYFDSRHLHAHLH
jgi:ketosteroid isomerase-like protein